MEGETLTPRPCRISSVTCAFLDGSACGVAVTIFGGGAPHGPARPALPGISVVTTPYLDRARIRRVPILARQYGLTKLLERLTYGAVAPHRGHSSDGATAGKQPSGLHLVFTRGDGAR